jgi:anti-sigma-K factor RskA
MSGEDRITNGRRCGDDVAAYVLGALEPGELEAFRRHLAGCADCQKEVAEFEQIRGSLPDSSVQYQVPKDLRRRVMAEVWATPKARTGAGAAESGQSRGPARVRRGWSWRPQVVWGGAFACVVVIAVVAVVALSSGGSSGTRVIQASAGSAQLRIAGGHGDLIVHRLAQLPAGRIYEMWVQRGSAQPVPTGTLFGVRSDGSATVGVPGSLSGVSAVLVTQEPAGGTQTPTSAPVIVARVT